MNGMTLDATCYASNSPADNPDLDDLSKITRAKQDRTRRALLSLLPDHDKLMKVCRENGSWWDTWRTKTPGTCGRFTTLVQFAERVLPKGSIGELGTLVLAYGVSLDGEKDTIDKYLAMVDRLVTSDDDYAATLEGMECLVLQFKCYADIGQPRRAWLQIRRAIVFAQLMGLHRNHARTPATESIWWSLYQADRFLSLMLGVPYTIHDEHCDLSLPPPEDGQPARNVGAFVLKISQIAGKVIDRTQSLGEQSYSSALDLDQELEGLKNQLPAGWWDVNAGSLHVPLPELRERLLMQLCYNQVRVYLHLPFMLKSPGNSRYEFSRAACLDASREMLQLYHELRSGGSEPLYECKATDFIGFTGSIVLLLGLLGYGRFAPVRDTAQEEKDWGLIDISMDIFRRASNEKGGKVAAQSYRVLEQLSSVRKKTPEALRQHNTGKVVVPYFGTISVRTGKIFQHPDDKGKGPASQAPARPHQPQRSTSANSKNNSSWNIQPSPSGSAPDGSFHMTVCPPDELQSVTSSTPSTSNNNQTPDTQSTSIDDPFVAYDGLYMIPPSADDGMAGIDTGASTTFSPVTGGSGGGGASSSHWTPGSESHTTWLNGNSGMSSGGAFGGTGGTFNSFGGGFNPLANAQGVGPAVMDIDQDWSWFLGEGAMGGQAHLPGGNPSGSGEQGGSHSKISFIP
jgi:hypothetical protein